MREGVGVGASPDFGLGRESARAGLVAIDFGVDGGRDNEDRIW